ncbi:proprotein convertase P-domain-containing protein [Marinobacter sp. F4216]|uniref:proprotein convertase P-domain-containing protein n=1 Tax=Marinobacter sp. F4216 TaxID=2874281 RepID=UPI001CBA9675|nr:proprotein convertase P-domain-containing protein [Marinobacter sp. F4216]MBZ2170382.1 PEP-CTERM sorting domain-containing protein [Marinobacter sp. F4216]
MDRFPAHIIALLAALLFASTAQARLITATNSDSTTVDPVVKWGTLSNWFDNGMYPHVVERSVYIADHGKVFDVNITVNWSKFDTLYETDIWLTSPSGASVYLFGDILKHYMPQNGAHNVSMTFDDQAPNALPYGEAHSGTFNLGGALSAFNGSFVTGDWTLTIADYEIWSATYFDSFTLDIWTDARAVAEPSTITLLGIALIGLGFARRRKSIQSN